MVLPRRVPLWEGEDFARSKARWIARALADTPKPVPFADGAEIPLLDAKVLLSARPDQRGAVMKHDGVVVVPGRPEHLPRRVGEWFRREAKNEIIGRVHDKAIRVKRRIRRIAVRDPRTLWGSCSPSGDLSFSWRLLMAPDSVLDYVIAHEVAHLVEHNHGPRFWSLVETLTVATSDSRAWLRVNGATLHRYG